MYTAMLCGICFGKVNTPNKYVKPTYNTAFAELTISEGDSWIRSFLNKGTVTKESTILAKNVKIIKEAKRILWTLSGLVNISSSIAARKKQKFLT